jgi:hypothetical protein
MKRFIAVSLALLGVLVVIAAWGSREAASVQKVSVDVAIPRLPRAFDGYRVLLLSCIHMDGFGETERALLRALEGTRADLTVIAGDFRGARSSLRGTLQGLDSILPALSAPDGIVACKGNHDTPLLIRSARERGIRFLMGQNIAVRRGDSMIWIAGVSEATSDSREVAQALAGIPPGSCTILIGHNPDVALPASRAGVDLVLAGDTHGGQITLPGLGPLVTKTTIGRRFCYGLNTLGETRVYTNPGIGTTGLGIRFGQPPEATCLILRCMAPAPRRAEAPVRPR